LHPPALASFSLEKAICSYVENFQKLCPQLKFELDLMTDGQLLAQPIRLGLFRICQELLNNVMWHAQASHVIIRFGIYTKQVILEVKDNGCGFKPPERLIELARQNHLGLIGVNERAQAMNGQMKVISVLGQGTLIRVVVPYSPAIETTSIDTAP
jgi:signal transduction histidine kinase